MKILNVYQKLEAHGWEMGYQLGRAFANLGHEVIDYGYGHDLYDPYASLTAVAFHHKDINLIFHTETNSPEDHYRVGKHNCPTALWLIDTHCVGVNQHWAYAGQYDFTFHATRQFVPCFGHNAFWLPNAASPWLHKKPKNSVILYDLGFCGSAGLADRPNYISYIDDLCKSMGMQFKLHDHVLKEDMLSAIANYLIHWNKTIANDLNARIFETTSIGTALLTNDVDGLHDLFEPGKEILVYQSKEDIKRIMNEVKNETIDVKTIAAAGQKRMHTNHTYVNRAQTILSTIFTPR